MLSLHKYNELHVVANLIAKGRGLISKMQVSH